MEITKNLIFECLEKGTNSIWFRGSKGDIVTIVNLERLLKEKIEIWENVIFIGSITIFYSTYELAVNSELSIYKKI